MPQLDKVTLFSQVFWFILLYFFSFIIFINYSLPSISKLLKIRSFFLEKSFSSFFNISDIVLKLIKMVNLLLNKIFIQFNELFSLLTQNNQSKLGFLTLTFFTKANSLFLKNYLTSILRLDISRKIYF